MKKTLLLILIVSHSMLTMAQNLSVTGLTTITILDPCMQTHTAPILVKNLSETDTFNVLCEKIIIDTTLNTSNHFCWGSNCYGSSTYISTDYNTLAPGEGDNSDFSGYYDAFCDLAPAIIQYCFFPDIDTNDRTCITISYNQSVSEVINYSSDFHIGNFSPNPSAGYSMITYDLAEDSWLNIIDILGNKVKKIRLSNNGLKRIYTGDLSKGIYFGNLVHDDRLIASRKLIVK